VLVEQIPAGVQARLRLKTTSFVSTLPRTWHGTHDLSSAFLIAVGFECELPNRSEISRTLLLKEFEQFCFGYPADGRHVPVAFPSIGLGQHHFQRGLATFQRITPQVIVGVG